MQVELAQHAPPGWDAFVDSRANATAWHRASAVAIGHEAYGLKTWYLTARDSSGEIAGILPMVEQSSPMFGHFLSSVPFFSYGGLLVAKDEARDALARAAAELGRQRGVKHVELRHTGDEVTLAWPVREDKVSMVLPLPATESELAKALGSKLRSQIKRAERESPEIAWGGEGLLDEFHAIYSEVMRDLGTPGQPLKFFRAYWKALGNRSQVLIVRREGVVQASAILVRHGDRIEVPWAAAGAAAKRGALNMRMYWELLRRCVAEGAPAFDFGRSTVDSGTYRFKAQWGAQPVQLRWHYWLANGGAPPVLNPHNPKYALMTATWKRLPIWATKLVGPAIIRSLP